MARSSYKTRMILAVAALAFLFVSTVDLRAQTNWKRVGIFEEWTGIWCPHCPPGAWAIDSLQEQFGDNLVVMAWHGPYGGDELSIRAGDTVGSAFAVQSWPTGIFQRYYVGGFGIMPSKDLP